MTAVTLEGSDCLEKALEGAALPGDKRPSGGVTVHNEGETQWWYDCRDAGSDEALVAAEHSNCSHIVMTFEQAKKINTAKTRVVWITKSNELDKLAKADWILTSSTKIYSEAKATLRVVGLHIKVNDLESEFAYCVEVCERGDPFVVIDIMHATYIPYELLVAKSQKGKTTIFRSIPIGGLQGVIDPVNQSLNAFATMEQGIGVLYRTNSADSVRDLSDRMTARQAGRVNLVEAEVIEVKHTGLGHRVCVDATSLMSPEEGLLIGSTGWGGIFVCSETHYLPHMNLREFRVNAGGAHSYVWGPNGDAMYLSEMRAGAEVLCVDTGGNSRVITVGRAKIERRPLINITCRIPLESVPQHIRSAINSMNSAQKRVTPSDEKTSHIDPNYVYINSFLQNDWHVRVMGADKVVRHSAMIKAGDKLLANVDIPGRHTGVRVEEHIIEK
ncbi:MAG: hypothetical protein JKY93_13135 [Gammaproteobacteria bacterium]|nr:hypothetical protein [Gammaproteobacteria bacterium]